jgi:hypothetical protein
MIDTYIQYNSGYKKRKIFEPVIGEDEGAKKWLDFEMSEVYQVHK